MIPRAILTPVLLLFSLPLFAQDLPDKIRGYKVYRSKIRYSVSTRSAGSEPVSFHGSKLVSASPLGVTFEADLNITPIPQEGRVDFLTFHDFTVNGVPVEIYEYDVSFSIRKNAPVVLPQPATAFLSTPRLAQAAWLEMRDSRPVWSVKGRVFIFGRFKKYGLSFKRVVPVDVAFDIENPVRR